ncbi:bifunctional diguanylate cyclase/phosphodiesterase [Allohahella marinimesophila]|uniref:Diguanylate cyclase (GGDEF)-like protein n=1 Tax=Allohahella marinimesophila TaxID=1054972 RepID=A0ABP7PAY6_9GAMM
MLTAFVCTEAHKEFLKLRHHSKPLAEMLQMTWCPKEPSLLQKLSAPRSNQPCIIIWDPSPQINAVALHGTAETLDQRSRIFEAVRDDPSRLLLILNDQSDREITEKFIAAGADEVMSRSEFSPALFQRLLQGMARRATSVASRSQPLVTPKPAQTAVFQQASHSEVMSKIEGAPADAASETDSFLNYDQFQMRVDLVLQQENDSPDNSCCVLYLNINNFRRISQLLGKPQARAFVRSLAEDIRPAVTVSHVMALLGGDEIGILLCANGDDATLSEIVQQIFHTLEPGVDFREQHLNVSLAVGSAVPTGADIGAEELIGNASIAMTRAKAMPGNSWLRYSRDFKEAVRQQISLEAEFRSALRTDELEVYYQPKLELATGRVRSVEALVRWPSPKRGMLLPNDFIPMAESSGMIVPMGYWVIEQVCKDLAILKRMGHGNLTCAVNLSFRQFHDRKLAETVFRIIYNADIATDNFEFELTETAMMLDTEFTIRSLIELRKLGLRFALDDFGTGYASFNNLRRLPISTVKIDQSFIRSVSEVAEDATLVEGMINLSHGLGLNVVAEGVETRSQLEFLHRIGCDEAQGFIIAPALPFEALCSFLDAAASASSDALVFGRRG